MRVLAALLEAQGRFVSRDDVVRAGWSGRPASDDSVSRCVDPMRCALGHPDGLGIVETAYGRGFRLAVPVRRIDGERTGSSIARLAQLRHASAFETWVAARALALDPEAVDALAVRGFVRAAMLGADDDGLVDLERAVSLDPQHWLTRHLLVWWLLATGLPSMRWA
jgi:hypothetical protein